MILHNNDKLIFGPADDGPAPGEARDINGAELICGALNGLATRFRLALFSAHLSPDAETVHHLRTMGRLLRVVLRAGTGLLQKARVETICSEIKWLHSELGHVRELDVLLADVLAPLIQAFPHDRTLAMLFERVRRERTAAARKLLKAVDSPRCARLLELLHSWHKAEWEPLRGRQRNRPAEDFAAAALERAWRRVGKAVDGKTGDDLAELHAARKRVKKLSDVIEMFGTVYPKGATRPLRRAASKLRGVLGEVQDSDTTVRLLRRLLRGSSSGLKQAGNLVLGYEARRLADALRRYPRAYKSFRRVEKFWK